MIPTTSQNSQARSGALGRVGPSLDSQGEAPIFDVARGDPSPEELAAVTVVLLAALTEQGPEQQSTGTGREWARRARLKLAPTPGPGAWRRSVRL
ncbi:acyl-CoA carboxylase subunit epsilon [Psychromicrobium xiongbiense]|uniref:acyl-CoA carboxylase subunit epsilon n=1 Tax=Psychromicrobium xiongbiense TaxID=3051184 RepID=UPI002556985D|nr:acyl-CoA carboxylase subunit epsilon [Psychromicrobium sp. YIM S02556]